MLSSFVVSRLVNHLISTDFGSSASRHDRTVFQRIFGTREALLQIFSAIDERVFYLQDTFPQIPIEHFAFGLFARWVPQEVPVESNMPKLTISPRPAHRMQALEREETRTDGDSPRAQSPAGNNGLNPSNAESDPQITGDIPRDTPPNRDRGRQ